jgi:enediyne biosynthesis protein E4
LLYRNTLAGVGNGHWVELKLIGTRSNRSAIGAEVTAEFGGMKQRQVVSGGTGFCSQNDRRLHFGLGQNRLGQVTIRWPSGTVQTLTDLAEDQLHVITEPGERVK